jgi:hypothetical protein
MKEVKTQDWAAFCDRVTQNSRGGTVSVHKVEPDGSKIEIAANVGFDGMDFGRQNECNDRISVRGSGSGLSRHDVIEPIRIQLAESENGAAFPSIIIEAEDGVTILTFHPTIKAPALNGLALR